MSNSDSLDNISLNSDELRSIQRFENDYYNYKIKKNTQIGGKNKLNNTERLIVCYLLSKNQTGGDSILTNKIKDRLNNKIIKNLEGGISDGISKNISEFIIKTLLTEIEKMKPVLENTIKKQIDGILNQPAKIAENMAKNATNFTENLASSVTSLFGSPNPPDNTANNTALIPVTKASLVTGNNQKAVLLAAKDVFGSTNKKQAVLSAATAVLGSTNNKQTALALAKKKKK
jgi:hypothetical protein